MLAGKRALRNDDRSAPDGPAAAVSVPPRERRAILDINHPSQAYILRAVHHALRDRGYETRVVARGKDVTLHLLRAFGIEFESLSTARKGKLGAFVELVQREARFYRCVRAFRPHVLIGTSVHAARASRLFGGRSVILNEDDASVVPLFTKLAYPGAHRIVTPRCLAYEAWGARHFMYAGTQKLFYLHRARFTPDRSAPASFGLTSPFAVVRFSGLTAHHDAGQRGLDRRMVAELAKRLAGRVDVVVSSEGSTPPPEGTRRLDVPPESMHHVLAGARFVLSDSQSMVVESAVLGVPAIRVNDFVGRISVMNELEKEGLAWGFRPEDAAAAIDLAAHFAADESRRLAVQNANDVWFEKTPDPLPGFIDMIDDLVMEV
jgi:predicted glycosyltransferase